jgi:hypothetical protein
MLAKSANIWLLGQHVADMLATFPAKQIPTGSDSNNNNQAGDCTELLVSGPLCHARKNLWMLPYHQAEINLTDGSGL